MGGVLSGSRGWRGGKRPTASLPVVRLTHADTYTLKYRPARVRIEGNDHGVVIHGMTEWPVAIDHTPLNYGGSRRWLVCPCCLSRRMALYIDGTKLACRVCLDLRYESQHENRRELAMRTANRMRAALGWKPGIANPPGRKPPYMHWRTFMRMERELDRLTDALFFNISDLVERHEARLNRMQR